jgi:cytochrome c-type biogenesis protein CcmH/NrfG
VFGVIMRRIGIGLLAAALLSGAPAWAQSEMEIYQQTGDALLNSHRESLQQNIDGAARAMRAKDYKAARKYAQAVTRADPKRLEAWLMLGAAQVGLQDWKAARGTYTTAIRLSPMDPEAHAGLGVAMARTKDLPKATQQVAWLDAQLQACKGNCAGLAKYKSDVLSAIAEGAKGA